MKVLILAGHYYPELHPRAFRAHELACEFARRGFDTKVVILSTILTFDYKKYEDDNNLKIQKLNLYKKQDLSIKDSKVPNSLFLFVNRKFRYLLEYFLSGRLLFKAKEIKNKLKISEDYDLVIALSTPFMNLLGVSLIRRNMQYSNTVFVADSGDPFSLNQQTKRAPYFFYLEKFVYKQFDFLAIPNEDSIKGYSGLIEPTKIKIIPQGFNFDKIRFAQFSETAKITFAFAGVFYLDIRNPEFLLKALAEIDLDFRFYVYLRTKDDAISAILKKYKNILGEKLNISYGISRDNLLYYLSSVDFLVNIENSTKTQVPSKLIDYAIVEKPIISFNSTNFSLENLHAFLKRDYSNSLRIDKSIYDIKKIANQFIELIHEK